MSIRFAAAGSGECKAVARVLSTPALTMAANDADAPIAADALLVSTLRHFALHGLNAAAEARRLTLLAQERGDRDQSHHWRAVCRQLDRRMADAIGSPRRR
jgi:hypothetical protein